MPHLIYDYAECHYTKCHCAKYHNAERRVFYYYAQCRYAECRYTECRGATIFHFKAIDFMSDPSFKRYKTFYGRNLRIFAIS
jgi:hypothetical protein